MGKICRFRTAQKRVRKHPHGRGEDVSPFVSSLVSPETPPRAWGRSPSPGSRQGSPGNTPTGVGKIRHLFECSRGREKHPHGRGEDFSAAATRPRPEETPPRAWGRYDRRKVCVFSHGNTPTGVGKIRQYTGAADRCQKHPHGRGEDSAGELTTQGHIETPPRAWGR